MPSPIFQEVRRCDSSDDADPDVQQQDVKESLEYFIEELQALRSFISDQFNAQHTKLDALSVKIDVATNDHHRRPAHGNSPNNTSRISSSRRLSVNEHLVFTGRTALSGRSSSSSSIRPPSFADRDYQSGPKPTTHDSKYRNSVSGKIFVFLEDPGGSAKTRIYHTILPFAIFATVVWSSLVSAFRCCSLEFAYVDIAIELCFTTELALRFFTCPNRSVFVQQFFNIVDIFTALPLVLRLVVHFWDPRESLDGRLLNVVLRGTVPVVRILKMLKHFTTIHLLTEAFLISLEALPVLLYMLTVIFMSGTCLLYVAEVAWDLEGGTISQAAWLIFTSMTTVGYGDVIPRTFPGKLAVAFVVLLTMLYMSIPLGIIGDAFGRVWGRRLIVLLLRKFRARLLHFGITPTDIELAFEKHSSFEDQQVNLTDFVNIVDEMGLGFSQLEVTEMFRAFDADFSGTCTVDEILLVLFTNCMSNEIQHYHSNSASPFQSDASARPTGSASLAVPDGLEDGAAAQARSGSWWKTRLSISGKRPVPENSSKRTQMPRESLSLPRNWSGSCDSW